MEQKSKATDIILDSIADGVFTVDREWRITSFNKAAEKITGIARDEAVGQQCCDVFHASICESDCALRKTFETEKPVVNKTVYIINLEGRRIPVSISTGVLKDEKGEIVGGVETFRDLSAVEELRRRLSRSYSFEDIISKSDAMRQVFGILPSVAESDTTVLIEGESGTGKELIARAIHNLSRRREKPMIAVNCGALPDTLLESELFGYKAGAFTDAVRDKPGRFALAEGGTLFLDEIADISPALQVRLLRVLQERKYEPLGAAESVDSDVRIIAAVNRHLETLVKKGKFREDLYYRINVLPIKIPPLRDRKEDIPLLIEHFIDRFNKIKSKEIADVSPEVLSILMTHGYPGNVRELENIIEHAFVLCKSTIIDIDCLPRNLLPEGRDQKTIPPIRSVGDFERNLILETLRKNNWSRVMTAAELGVDKSTLWRKMKRLKISPYD
jgi:PAS domain S-box-containing protein